VEQVYDPQKGEMVPKHLKAIAPISAYCDNYSDIVVPGGNIDAEFMAIWIVLTDLMSVIPPDLFLNQYTKNGITAEETELASQIWAEHTDHLMLPVQWVIDPSREYKTEWNELKSPMIYWPQKPAGGWTFSSGIPKAMGGNTICKNLPVFTATGWFDIFERGSLYNYQYGLANHSASDKAMIIGPWYHIDAAFTFPGITGLGLIGEENIFSWDVLVRWFDWKIKGKNDPFMVDYPVALYVLGEEKWRAEKSWPLPASRLTDKTYYFSKTRPSLIPGDWFSLSNYSNNYTLVSTPSDSDYYYKFLWFKIPRSNPELQHDPTDLHGVTSRSAQRWLGFSPLTVLTQTFKYVLNINTDAITFWEDERDDEKGVLTFTTEPLTEDLEISGPLKLTFWASTEFNDPMTQAKIDETLATIKTRYSIEGDKNNLVNYADKRDVQWVVEVNDVFANGRARNISSGCLSAAHRPYDPSSPTSVDPAYTAFDPFYNRGDKNPLPISENTLYQYVIEILPVTNVFKKGHRIRVSISGSDFPHLFPVFRPSINTLVLDEAHKAKIDFKAANKTGEGTCWKWIDNISDYLLKGI
jgi:predicted acyl esterase